MVNAKNTKVLCFGNEFFGKDKIAKEIAEEIKIPGVEFIKCDTPEKFFFTNFFNKNKNYKNLFILDVAKNIKKVTLIEDLNKIKNIKSITLHDFDLSFFLKLKKELEKDFKIKIICIPMKGNKKKIIGEIKKIIKSKKN